MFNIDSFRQQFPVLGTQVNGKDFYYFDTAATSLKPRPVADRIHDYYLFESANIHRGSHYLGRLGTENYEAVRQKAARFINAPSQNEIVFVKGVTEAINLLAYSYGQALTPKDVVVVSGAEHHSNIVPWSLLRDRTHCQLQVLSFKEDGSIDDSEIEKALALKPAIVSLILYSNVTGVRFDVEKVLQAFKGTPTITVVDAAQAVLHERLDVQALGVDFLTLSAHKMFGPFGTGILYGKKDRLEECPPFMGGGSMISQVSWDKIILQSAPHKFEAGTPNIADVIGFGVAIDFIEQWGVSSWTSHTRSLVEKLEKDLEGFERIRQIGPRTTESKKADIVSFVYDGAHASDVGEILDQMGIAVRAGHHCAQPLMQQYGIAGTVRVSFGPYNTLGEVDFLVQALKKVGSIL